jgi:hypothetical protein
MLQLLFILKDQHALENIFHIGSRSLNIFITKNSKISIYLGSGGVHTSTISAPVNKFFVFWLNKKNDLFCQLLE